MKQWFENTNKNGKDNYNYINRAGKRTVDYSKLKLSTF